MSDYLEPFGCLGTATLNPFVLESGVRCSHRGILKATCQDGALQPALLGPCQILLHSNQERYRKEKGEGESGRDLGIWLPSWTL